MAQKEKKYTELKIVLVFAIFLLASILSINFSSAQTRDRVGCCVNTLNGNTCVDYTYESDCQSGQFFNGVCSAVVNCKPFTCATPNGCYFNYPRLTCETEGGSISLQAMPDVCNEGCCGIANRGYGILTKKECQDKTSFLGYEISMMEFTQGLTETECDLKYAGSDRGCCYNGAATCSFGTREECIASNGIFRQGIYCSQIVECEAFANQSQQCGVLDGDKNKKCNFDSQGNQEDCTETCNINTHMCKMVTNSKDKVVPICVSTNCILPSGLQHQNVTEIKGPGDGNVVESVSVLSSGYTILNGHSVCYNFYTSNEKGNPDESVDIAVGKSTGLQNNKLVCMYGEIVSEGLGVDREKLCINSKDEHALIQTNDWENCSQCGSKGNTTWTRFLDPAGEIFGAGDFLVAGFSTALSNMGKFCTKSECEALGDCVYTYEFDRWSLEALNGNNSIKVGATCSPKYTPGTPLTCKICGNTGDWFYNECSVGECSLQGDCEFTPNNGFTGVGLGAGYGIMLAITAKFNLIPLYSSIDCTVNNLLTPGAIIPCIPTKIGTEIGEIVAGPFKGTVSALGTIVGGVTSLGSDIISSINGFKSMGNWFKI